jgi:hypothetical protein
MPQVPRSPTVPEVKHWLEHASNADLNGAGVERLLRAAEKALSSESSPTLKDLATEVDDILRRCAADRAAR